MDYTLNFLHAAQDIITEPGVGSILPLFILSFVNDLTGIFPFALVLAGQLLFLQKAFTLALAAKLLVFVAVPVGLGSAFGSLPIYALAYFGGKPAINKLHRFLHFSWEDVEKMNQRFKGTVYDEVVFLFLRCMPILPSFPLDIAGGILRMRFWPFFVLTAVGSIIRMMLTMLVVGLSMHSLSQL